MAHIDNLLVFVALFGLCLGNDSQNHVKSRSGDIVVMNAQPIKGDGLLIAVTSANEDLSTSKTVPSSMSETEVAGLVSHVIGSLPLQASVPKQASVFASSILKKPRANLMLVLADLGHYTVQELSMSYVQDLSASHPSFTMAASFEPRNLLSQVVTLSTGKLPSVHGVIGSEWKQGSLPRVSAFSQDQIEQGSHAAVPTVADVVAMTFEDPVVVSFSGCSKLAAASATHPSSGKRSSILSIDSSAGRLRSQGSFSVLSAKVIDSSDVSELFNVKDSQSLLARYIEDGAVVSVDGRIVTVQPFANADEANTVQFDMDKQSDFTFFAEFAGIQNILSALGSGEFGTLLSDSNPDLYTITLVGLSGLMNEYGSSSLKVKVAAHLLDVAATQTIRRFEMLYQNEIATELILTGSRPLIEKTVKSDVSAIVGNRAHPEMKMHSTFPHIYVEEAMSTSDIQSLCSQVHDTVSKHGLKADCFSQFSKSSLLQSKTMLKSTNSTASLDNVIQYQLNLWVSVLLVVLLFGAIYPLMYLDVTTGTFSSFLFAKKYV